LLPRFAQSWLPAARAIRPCRLAAHPHLGPPRRPAAWPAEDQRKHQGLAHCDPELGAHLTRPLTWHPTGDPSHPWATEVKGNTWQIRINDFPDELLYSLIINETPSGKHHDWPEAWQRRE
jgi:hypothetical protein